MPEKINHPTHYGGDTVYETIKVIEAWNLNFRLGNAVKYISRSSKKGSTVEDLKKALWYLQREINFLEDHNSGKHQPFEYDPDDKAKALPKE